MLVYPTLLGPKVGIDLACNDDVVKEWGSLGAKGLKPSAVSYETPIRAGAQGAA